MAFLVDTATTRPSLPSRPEQPFVGIEWLVSGAYALLLVAILALNGLPTLNRTPAPSDTAVCQQRLPAMLPGLFTMTLH